MPVANARTYLADVVRTMKQHWPQNRTINVVCHGHSVPAGYFATPLVDTFNAYPHLLHVALKQRFPFAVINVIVTAIGGEDSLTGAGRFEQEVLCHRPDVLTIDYGLNDRRIGLESAAHNWREMVAAATASGARVVLLTPTHDNTQHPGADPAPAELLRAHARQIRELAAAQSVGLADSFAAFERYVAAGRQLTDLLSWPNHPNRAGHDLVVTELMRYFPVDAVAS